MDIQFDRLHWKFAKFITAQIWAKIKEDAKGFLAFTLLPPGLLISCSLFFQWQRWIATTLLGLYFVFWLATMIKWFRKEILQVICVYVFSPITWEASVKELIIASIYLNLWNQEGLRDWNHEKFRTWYISRLGGYCISLVAMRKTKITY